MHNLSIKHISFCVPTSPGEAMGTATPILITVYPRNDGVMSRRLIAAIRVPSIYQPSPPTPTDTAVKIEERPGMTVYALWVSALTRAGSKIPSHFLPGSCLYLSASQAVWGLRRGERIPRRGLASDTYSG